MRPGLQAKTTSLPPADVLAHPPTHTPQLPSLLYRPTHPHIYPCSPPYTSFRLTNNSAYFSPSCYNHSQVTGLIVISDASFVTSCYTDVCFNYFPSDASRGLHCCHVMLPLQGFLADTTTALLYAIPFKDAGISLAAARSYH